MGIFDEDQASADKAISHAALVDAIRAFGEPTEQEFIAYRQAMVPRRFVWNLTARIHRSGARWGLWATRQSELSTNPPGGAFC